MPGICIFDLSIFAQDLEEAAKRFKSAKVKMTNTRLDPDWRIQFSSFFVVKLLPQETWKRLNFPFQLKIIINFKDQNNSDEKYHAKTELSKMQHRCTIRISFGEGFGEQYPRKTINGCKSWLEIKEMFSLDFFIP